MAGREEEEVGENENEEENGSSSNRWRLRNRRVAEKFAATSSLIQSTLKRKQHGQVSSTPTGFQFHEQQQQQQSEEWCGPFTVARQLLEKREEARLAKEAKEQEKQQDQQQQQHPLDQVMNEMNYQKQLQQHPSLTWKPTIHHSSSSSSTEEQQKYDNLYVKRKKRKLQKSIPSLYTICIQYIVQHIDHVESLGPYLPDSIRKSLADTILDTYGASKLTFPMLQLITGDDMPFSTMQTIDLLDATQMSPIQLTNILQKQSPSLQILKIQHAGRCINQQSVKVLASSCTLLTTLSLSGAYMLQDADAAHLLQSCHSLTSITFQACPNLSHQTCTALSKNENLMELSLHDIPFTTKQIQSLIEPGTTYPQLQRVSLSQIHVIDDSFLSKFFPQIQPSSLKFLELRNLPSLTDLTLDTLRSSHHYQTIRSLHFENLPSITTLGLETFFTPNIEGLPNPSNQLRTLHLSQFSHEVVNDTIMELAATMSSMKPTTLISTNPKNGNGNISSGRHLSTMGGLTQLHLQQSAITDRTLEVLVDTCTGSLKELDVSFCCNITNAGLGYLVDKIGDQLESITIWGCAQITEEFLDGHSRFGHLNITGAWMKQTSPNQPLFYTN